jgi:2-hydroxychromene-2-carboxylate isomerase
LAGSLRDRVQRSLAPRAVVALSRLRLPRPWPPRVELYFAYDDPYAVLALPGLLALTRARGLPLHLYPLLERGIPGDPAAEQRRHYALVDADRLLQRRGLRLCRRQPLAAADCAFLAAWTQAAAAEPAGAGFAAAALEQLWLHGDGPVEPEAFAPLHRDILRRPPPADSPQLAQALRGNTRRLHARGHWESPAARVGGEWFFAHERLPQIAERLT